MRGKKRWLCMLLAWAACLSLPGCGWEGREEPELVLWFSVDQSLREVPNAALESQPYQGAESVAALMEALLAGPEPGSGLAGVIPPGTQLLDWAVEGEVAYLNLSQPYGDLMGVERTLADYCITLTLTQLEGVEGVSIAVNGSQAPGQGGVVLQAGDVVFSGVEEEPVELPVALYFRRAGTLELGYELRVLLLTEEDSPAQAVLEALLAGPEDEGLAQVLPQGLEVRSARVEGGVCYADFSSALVEQMPGSGEEQALVVESIVNTLCSLDTVDAVQLLVEGQDLLRYGQLELDKPMEFFP